MFELSRSLPFFEKMDSDYAELVQNIEIVHENKVALDTSYHRPKQFILHLNNLLRSLIFFVENSQKNSPEWLEAAVNDFVSNHRDDYRKIRHLRNVSAHQKLIFPNESLVVGLYRIRSEHNYTLKIGFGDHNGPGRYAWDLTLKNTSDVFHDMLTFASITFMDLEHSAIGECLGITRRWYFKIKFKSDSYSYNEVTDVYELASKFATSLLDHVCDSYADETDIIYDYSFKLELSEHNFINTLLEIDLFPDLFSEWWEDNCSVLNFGVRQELMEGQKHVTCDLFHRWTFDNLSADMTAYQRSLEQFAAMPSDDVVKGDNFKQFLSFILTNHWHYKRVFGGGLGDHSVSASDVMLLQRAGNIFLEELRKNRQCAISSAKKQLNDQIENILSKIKTESTA